MMTKYGEIPNIAVNSSLKRLTDKVFKILPMREEECDTLDVYVHSLLRELIGSKKLVEGLMYEDEFMSLISTLEGLADNNVDLEVCKSDVFKSLGIIKKMRKNILRRG